MRTRACTCAARPRSSSARRTCSSSSATTGGRSMPSASAPPGAEMTAYWLDGNAVAGLLIEALGEDMTAVERHCEDCGAGRALGAYRAYLGAGVVLRCPSCGSAGLRVVEMADGFSVSWAGRGPPSL